MKGDSGEMKQPGGGPTGRRRVVKAEVRKRQNNALANKRFREKRKEEIEGMKERVHELSVQVAEVWSENERLKQKREECRERVEEALQRTLAGGIDQEYIVTLLASLKDSLSSSEIPRPPPPSGEDEDAIAPITTTIEDEAPSSADNKLWKMFELSVLAESTSNSLFDIFVLKGSTVPRPNVAGGVWDIFLDDIPDRPYFSNATIHAIQQGTFFGYTPLQILDADIKIYNPEKKYLDLNEKTAIEGYSAQVEALTSINVCLINMDLNHRGPLYQTFGDRDVNSSFLNVSGSRMISEEMADKILSGNYNMLMGRIEGHPLSKAKDVEVLFNAMQTVKSMDRVRWHRSHIDNYFGCIIFQVKGGAHYTRIARAAVSSHLSNIDALLGVEPDSNITSEEMRTRMLTLYRNPNGSIQTFMLRSLKADKKTTTM